MESQKNWFYPFEEEREESESTMLSSRALLVAAMLLLAVWLPAASAANARTRQDAAASIVQREEQGLRVPLKKKPKEAGTLVEDAKAPMAAPLKGKTVSAKVDSRSIMDKVRRWCGLVY